MRTAKTLIRLGAHSVCRFCHDAAQLHVTDCQCYTIRHTSQGNEFGRNRSQTISLSQITDSFSVISQIQSSFTPSGVFLSFSLQ